MFPFQRLEVYKKAKVFSAEVDEMLDQKNISWNKSDQLSRAAFSVVLNIGEGSGRFSGPDKRRFFIIARSSVYECVAALDMLHDRELISTNEFISFSAHADELSRMLYRMIKNLS